MGIDQAVHEGDGLEQLLVVHGLEVTVLAAEKGGGMCVCVCMCVCACVRVCVCVCAFISSPVPYPFFAFITSMASCR